MRLVRFRPAALFHGVVCRLYSTPGKVKVNVRTSDGTMVDFRAPEGMTLMHAIRDVGQLFMEDCCVGTMKCTTCHVYVAPGWMERVGLPCEEEQDMLDKAIDPQENSRLCCQVLLTPELDGVEVSLPKNTINLMLDERNQRPKRK